MPSTTWMPYSLAVNPVTGSPENIHHLLFTKPVRGKFRVRKVQEDLPIWLHLLLLVRNIKAGKLRMSLEVLGRLTFGARIRSSLTGFTNGSKRGQCYYPFWLFLLVVMKSIQARA